MDKVLVDPASKTVAVQGGAKWGDVDVAAAEHGLAVVGCTVNHIGVSGSSLGGGYGWLTGRYGLVIDNLLSVKMVLADGRIVMASATENPDLFWAVRGAGQSFGVATELVFRAHPQRDPVFGGSLFFSADKLPKIVEFVNRFEQLTDGNQALFLGFTTSPLTNRTAVQVMTFYNGPRSEAESFFQPLLSLGPDLDETDMILYPKINGLINKASMSGDRKKMSGTNITLPLDNNFVQEIYEEFDHIMEAYPVARDSILTIQLIPYTQATKVPNDATAYANRGPHFNVQSIFCWSDADLDSKMHSLQQNLLRKIVEGPGPAKGQGGVGGYANYIGMSHLYKGNGEAQSSLGGLSGI